MRFFGLIFLCAMGLPGIGMLTGAWWAASNTMDYRESAERVTGTITRANPPLAEFFVNDEPFVAEGSVSSKPPAYSVGEQVEVLYLPDDPSDARIDSFLENWFVTTLLGILGTVFTAAGFGVFFLGGGFNTKRGRARSPQPPASSGVSSGPDVSFSDRQTIARILRMGARSEALRYATGHLKLDNSAADALVREIEAEAK
ncbi:MAG: DUF3592 domain-containing protein [Myxococcota bacterium]